MFYKPLLYPLLIQVALTFLVMFRLFLLRAVEFRRRRIDPDKVPTRTQMQESLTDYRRYLGLRPGEVDPQVAGVAQRIGLADCTGCIAIFGILTLFLGA